tara:strand:- start:1223 stop:2230 length:1008 start_codon:yes stop_codon:yes gene_type:complete
MSLATYASPYEYSNTNMNVLYSKSNGNSRNQHKKTRRKQTNKSKDITNIIKMLHQNASDDDETPTVKEGMQNFNDNEANSYITNAIDHTQNAYNYSQIAAMDHENHRIQNDTESAREISNKIASSNASILHNSFDDDDDIQIQPNQHNESFHECDPEQVPDDSSFEWYKPVMNKSPTTENHEHTYQNIQKQIQQNTFYDEYPDSNQDNFLEYDANNKDTYVQSKHIRNYDFDENDNFSYPKWATKKNRKLNSNRNLNNHTTNQNSQPLLPSKYKPQNYDVEKLMKKMDYLIHMIEENEETKTNYVIEELILYGFLGFFVLFVVDSFTNVNKKYKR